ncbi:hypothetical protein DL95DRAFT_469720 [Leptodontidium sp. 2 PMI_412]|nr:hypothetical protein DL95DRAFT_469720 [Leptodontidium sp. 2 PMI_412]
MVEIRTIVVMGATGRGVIDALSFTKEDIEYRIRQLTRSRTSKLAQCFNYDWPQLSLVQWTVDDVSSLEKCFEDATAPSSTRVFSPTHETPVKEWTRTELALGERFVLGMRTRGRRKMTRKRKGSYNKEM